MARRRDYSALVLVEVILDEENPTPYAKIAAIKQWPHVAYDIIWNDCERIFQKKRWRMLLVDQSMSGENALEEFSRRGVTASGLMFNAKNKHDMITFLIMLMQDKRLKFPAKSFKELKSQIAEQERIISASASPLYAHPENRHDDQLWALCLALHAARRELTGVRPAVVSSIDYGAYSRLQSLDWGRGFDQSYQDSRFARGS